MTASFSGSNQANGRCWIDDGFYSEQCTSSSSSNCYARTAVVRAAGPNEVGSTRLLTTDVACKTEFGFGPIVCASTVSRIHNHCEIEDCVRFFPCPSGSSWDSLECDCLPNPTPTPTPEPTATPPGGECEEYGAGWFPGNNGRTCVPPECSDCYGDGGSDCV